MTEFSCDKCGFISESDTKELLLEDGWDVIDGELLCEDCVAGIMGKDDNEGGML